jgi:tetratricopeptide (TPR) repeat protein
MRTISEMTAAARRCQQAGDLEGAERACREAVGLRPDHSEAWYLLGAVCQARGRSAEAGDCYRRVIEADPYSAEAYNSLGVLHARQGERPEALACFERAVRVRPQYPHGHNNRGNVLKELGRFDEALASYREAVRFQPDYAEALNNLGNLLRERGQFEEAEVHSRQAVRLRPDFAQAHCNLGAALAGRQRFAEAVESFRDAIRLDSRHVEARNNLGAALARLGRVEEAVTHFREALDLAPEYTEAHRNLADVLRDLGRPDESLPSCHALVRLVPDDPDTHSRLGLTLSELGRQHEALEAYARSIEIDPTRRESHRNRSLIWLLLGEYELGWAEYEWRWGCKELPVRPFPRPLWDGSPLGGRTILLHAEQGLGDTLQFIRYATLVHERGGRVVVASQRPLLRLLATCPGVEEVVAQGDPIPAFDVHAPLLSLPRIFGTTVADVPARVPYLSAEPALVESWRAELREPPGLKVGIAWQGSTKYRRDRQRSFRPDLLAPLAELPGVRLVNLQKGHGRDQLDSLAERWQVFDAVAREDETQGAFRDTAAVITNLDLVVACDSAIGHLAGALGVPVWIAMPFVPDWRWLLDRDDSPWYPTVRLFRQDRPGAWEGVFQRMAFELSGWNQDIHHRAHRAHREEDREDT